MSLSAYGRLTMAIERIKAIGWLQGGTRQTDTGAGCAFGSLITNDEYLHAPLITLWHEPSLVAAVNAMGFESPGFVESPDGATPALALWNDVKGRTKEEVLARLEAARDRILHQEADKGAPAEVETVDVGKKTVFGTFQLMGVA